MNLTFPRISLLALGLAVVALPSRAQLLNAAYESQLVTWINHGALTFTNDFTKVAGDGQVSLDFHAAADGKGPTVSLFDVTPFDVSDGLFDLPDQVIGGASPASWDSSNTWNIVLNPMNQSAFLFNLSDGVTQHENVMTLSGLFQTFDSPAFGPVFGVGDLIAGTDLEYGAAIHNSYGGTSALTPNILGNVGVNSGDLFKINRLEVYSVALASIPEPATYALFMAAGLAAVVMFRRRNRPTASALRA